MKNTIIIDSRSYYVRNCWKNLIERLKVFRLEEKHLDAVKEIAIRNRKKRSCSRCYDRGYIGVSEENLLVLCTKCVDIEKAQAEWKEYVKEHEDLLEHFADLFKEDDTGEKIDV